MRTKFFTDKDTCFGRPKVEHNEFIAGELYQHLHSSKIIVMYIAEPSDSEVEKWHYLRGCAKVLYGDRITFAQKSNLRKCSCQND